MKLSQNAKNVLSVLLMYEAKEHFSDTFGSFDYDLVPFPEYMSDPKNAKNAVNGFVELWAFAGLPMPAPEDFSGGGPDLKLM